MAEPAILDLKNCYSKQIVFSKTATEEKIFIYYPEICIINEIIYANDSLVCTV